MPDITSIHQVPDHLKMEILQQKVVEQAAEIDRYQKIICNWGKSPVTLREMRQYASLNGAIRVALPADADSTALLKKLTDTLRDVCAKFGFDVATFSVNLEEAHSGVSEMGDWHSLSPEAKDKRLREMADSASAKVQAGTPPTTAARGAQKFGPVTDEMHQQWLESAKSKMGIKS